MNRLFRKRPPGSNTMGWDIARDMAEGMIWLFLFWLLKGWHR